MVVVRIDFVVLAKSNGSTTVVESTVVSPESTIGGAVNNSCILPWINSSASAFVSGLFSEYDIFGPSTGPNPKTGSLFSTIISWGDESSAPDFANSFGTTSITLTFSWFNGNENESITVAI